MARFDAEKILQDVRNLLSNAIQFSPEGKLTEIHFAEGSLALSQGFTTVPSVSLSVTDSGMGLPRHELQTIFDKFAQSSKTRSGAGGTGLRLAIFKEIIEANEGKIQAANRAEGVAIVTFTLPRQSIGSGSRAPGYREL